MVYAIDMVVKCLKIDFGHLFSSRFKTEDELRGWKNRLWKKLKGLGPQDVLDGYEMLTERNPSDMPEIPELLSATLHCQKMRLADEKNRAEAERLSALPHQPGISESVARQNLAEIRRLLGDVMSGMEKKETGQQQKDRLTRLEEKRIAHEALLDKDFPLRGKDVIPHPGHTCSVGWCPKPGTMSSAITGNGNFYCREHFRN